MTADPGRTLSPQTYAAIRFGYGFNGQKLPDTGKAMLTRLAGPDTIARTYPVPGYEEVRQYALEFRKIARARRQKKPGAEEAYREGQRAIQDADARNLATAFARIVETDDPFRERLTWFWSSHFTAYTSALALRPGNASYVEEAIRPHVGGRFADMLYAVVTHPVMLIFLDQASSIGPASVRAQKNGGGLNENLAREVMELHTLGVDANYTQTDVTQFAELLTGLIVNGKREFAFVPNVAEPGAEQVLGQSYGGGKRARLEDIRAALDDLARHPATARHLSRKLAAHFVSDLPDPDMVAQMEAAYRASDGHLPTVYATMLDHPAAWHGFGGKMKQPFDFLASALVALPISGDRILKLPRKKFRQTLFNPLRAMGQFFLRPEGPDGWPDTEADWLSPPGLAQRITWALNRVPQLPGREVEPRMMAESALGDAASPKLLWAASAAETRDEGVAVVFASPDFNRR